MGGIATVHNLAGGNFEKGLASMHRSLDLSFHVCAVNLLCLKFLLEGDDARLADIQKCTVRMSKAESSSFLWGRDPWPLDP